MIKNIIFDLGNVLISFQPKKYLRSTGLNRKDTNFILREIYQSDEWVELDRGTISSEEALNAICSRNPERKSLLRAHSDFMKILTPIEKNTVLLQELKALGFNLYYLTNYHSNLFQKSFQKYDFFRYFDGGIVSAAVNLIKPDPLIYERLLDKYKLNAGECLFIDDSKKNTAVADKLEMKSLHLKNPKNLKKKLYKVTGSQTSGVL